ncbi:MAG: S8 family serine peptidase [Methylovulum sp.]|nr:S8 family serine peptidase [Methylovulum sp.]
MTWLYQCLWLGMIGMLVACAGNSELTHVGDSAVNSERRLLVTFADQSIDRPIQGNSQDAYRPAELYRNSSWSSRKAQELAERHHLRLITQWPVTELGVSCVLYEVQDNLRLAQVMQTLQQDPSLSVVQALNRFDVLSQPPALSPNSDPYQHLQTGFQALDIADWHPTTTGRGIRIAVIDTGVDVTHPDLQGQIKYSENLAPEPADHNLADIHGTAVTGVLAARPHNGIGITGIAPDADILALRACWPSKPDALAAQCNSFTLALALNQALRMDSRIINLSLSGPDDPLLRQLLEKALAKGVLIVAAVPDKGHANGFPANLPGVVAVGADNSNQPGIIAPGKDILTTVPHQAYDFMTGSSFAAPHVTGVAALLLQLHPDWQTADLLHSLRGTANTLTTHRPNAVTAGVKQGGG